MRWLGMAAALLTLAAAALGLVSLAGFGLTLRDQAVLLVQVGLGVAVFMYLLIRLGRGWARWMNRADGASPGDQEIDGDEARRKDVASRGGDRD